MARVLKIEIGTFPFTGKEIDLSNAKKIFADFLLTVGIEADLDVKRTDAVDFLTINGYTCRFPSDLIKEVNDYVGFSANSKKATQDERLYWELFIYHILWMQPQVLFSQEHLDVYMPALKSIRESNSGQVRAQCKEIIDELLNMKIALTNSGVIAEISNTHLNSPEINWNEFREDLIDALTSREIEVLINPDYFNKIIASDTTENLFEMMRDGLFYETGIKYPPFRIVFDSNLPFAAFQFKINSFRSIPVTGLEGEVLVNDSPDRLTLLGIKGKGTSNPANGNVASIIEMEDKVKADNSGLITWNALGYFILCFSRFLRRYGYACVDRKFTLENLTKLQYLYPKANELIEENSLLSLTTKTLRLLAKDEISIRNLRVILEAILESDYIIADGNQYIIFDERTPVQADLAPAWKTKAENVVEFVRCRLKKYISHKHTRGASTLIVYLLDPEIEKMVDAEDALTDDERKMIHKAVQNEIGNLPLSSQVPVILTTVNVRAQVRKIIESDFPHIAVLSYQELSPEMNIQPIARISLQ